MVGQLPLEQHIGVRIPGGQPIAHKNKPKSNNTILFALAVAGDLLHSMIPAMFAVTPLAIESPAESSEPELILRPVESWVRLFGASGSSKGVFGCLCRVTVQDGECPGDLFRRTAAEQFPAVEKAIRASLSNPADTNGNRVETR